LSGYESDCLSPVNVDDRQERVSNAAKPEPLLSVSANTAVAT